MLWFVYLYMKYELFYTYMLYLLVQYSIGITTCLYIYQYLTYHYILMLKPKRKNSWYNNALIFTDNICYVLYIDIWNMKKNW